MDQAPMNLRKKSESEGGLRVVYGEIISSGSGNLFIVRSTT
jgi:hypothetical protein